MSLIKRHEKFNRFVHIASVNAGQLPR